MKNYINVFVLLLLALASCQPKSDGRAGEEAIATEENEVLVKEAWRIHDEVMPKMSSLYKLKGQLKEKLGNPGLSEEEKKGMENTILQLDSAYDGMMDWMHNFEPEEYTESDENAREYLENEIEKINKVKQDILNAIARAESAVQ